MFLQNYYFIHEYKILIIKYQTLDIEFLVISLALYYTHSVNPIYPVVCPYTGTETDKNSKYFYSVFGI